MTAQAIPALKLDIAAPPDLVQKVPVYRRLDPSWAEIAILALMTLSGGVALAYQGAYDIFNVVIPVTIIITMATGGLAMLREDAANLWTPILWMRTAVLVYFGIGSLVPLFANSAAKSYIETLFLYFPADILKFNLVVTLFVTIVLSFTAVADRMSRRRRQQGANPFYSPRSSILSLPVLGALFLLIGSLFNFGLLLPQALGLSTVAIPNTLNEIGMLAYVGLFFLSAWAFSTRNVLLIPILLLGLVYVAFGLIQFSKTSTLYPVILIMIGFLYRRVTRRRLIAVALVIAATYLASNSIVQDGRQVMIERYDSLNGAGLAERIDIIRFGSAAVGTQVAGDVNYGLTRLSYTNVGTFVISEYDQGLPGNSTANALATVIPRFIWPDKPIITDVARELAYQATGIYDNNIAPTLPADAYWNGGWEGVVLWAFVAGSIYWLWSCYTIAVLRSEAWHLFAVVLIGARLGSRVDGFLVVDLIGPLTAAIVGHILLTVANNALAGRADSRR